MNEAANNRPEPVEPETQQQAEEWMPEEDGAPDAEAEAGQLQAQAEEIARLKDQYLRAAAETENVRNRSRREIEDASKYGVTKFARDIVSVVENLQRASDSISADARAGSDVLRQVGEGIDMSMAELLSIFERNGIKRINPLGEKFDHNLHQAVAQVPSNDMPPGHVLQVLQAGYSLHDRLLKPAMVTVATAANA